MPFQSLLAADRIVLLVEAKDRDAVLDAAARLLADASPANTQVIADGLRRRERLGSTVAIKAQFFASSNCAPGQLEALPSPLKATKWSA